MAKEKKATNGAGGAMRSTAMTEALRDVEELDKQASEKVHKVLSKKGHSRDLEKKTQNKVESNTRQQMKDESLVKKSRAEKALGGVRGKFHPSKKGQGKTVSNRSVKRRDSQK